MLIYATTGFVFPLIQDEVANKAYHGDHCVLCQMIFMWNKMMRYITTRLIIQLWLSNCIVCFGLMKSPKTAIFETRNKFSYFIWKGFLCELVQWRIYDWRNQISIGGKSYIMCISMMMMQWRGKITCLCAHNFQSIIH